MKGEHEDGIPTADSEGCDECRLQQMEIEPHIVWIEESLCEKGFLKDSVRKREDEDACPAPSRSADGFSNQQRSAAVDRSENDQHPEHFNGHVAQQELGNQRRDEEQPNGGHNAAQLNRHPCRELRFASHMHSFLLHQRHATFESCRVLQVQYLIV